MKGVAQITIRLLSSRLKPLPPLRFPPSIGRALALLGYHALTGHASGYFGHLHSLPTSFITTTNATKTRAFHQLFIP